ncbi:MAG: ribose-phosphate pyrophosphokinase [Endomicrobium sp.]|jgi:ribose-phosphate pyrophosphokinase|nr:ribose-phosphate pyrophosphokinase [Endomicrobium sp.]
MKIKLISGNANINLAKQISSIIGVNISNTEICHFNDGEIQVKIFDNISNNDCYIIQPTNTPVNENLMELLIIADALKRSSAKSITAVVPYYGYARQDRKVGNGTPITAKLIANLIVSSGITKLITIDLHSTQIQGFFDIPVEHICSAKIFSNYFKNKHDNFIVVSPDIGGVSRARFFAKLLNVDLAVINKQRINQNELYITTLIGNVKNKNCIIFDDIIDTGKTIVKVVDFIKKNGALKIFVAASHGVFSNDSKKIIHNSCIEELIITNSINFINNYPTEKITILSVAEILAETIKNINKKTNNV